MSVFVDTGAWFAYFVRRDSDHHSARTWVSTNESPLVTSDYILDELFTLLKIAIYALKMSIIGMNLFEF